MVCTQLKYSFQKKFFSSRFDNTAILLVSGVVLIFVFVLTLVFGIIRIVNTAPNRVIVTASASTVLINSNDITPENQPKRESDKYALAEDVTKLIIELVFILFAILATFALFRYIKAKYAAVPTREK
jgi:hypothetical protein